MTDKQNIHQHPYPAVALERRDNGTWSLTQPSVRGGHDQIILTPQGASALASALGFAEHPFTKMLVGDDHA